MTADVVPFRIPLRPVEDFVFDALFESLKGYSYQRVLVVALDGDGDFEWWGNLNQDEACRLLAKATKELAEYEE